MQCAHDVTQTHCHQDAIGIGTLTRLYAGDGHQAAVAHLLCRKPIQRAKFGATKTALLQAVLATVASVRQGLGHAPISLCFLHKCWTLESGCGDRFLCGAWRCTLCATTVPSCWGAALSGVVVDLQLHQL